MHYQSLAEQPPGPRSEGDAIYVKSVRQLSNVLLRVCLYLALAERLTGGMIDLVMLDDVVMSVDAEHRRQVCHLMATERVSDSGRESLKST